MHSYFSRHPRSISALIGLLLVALSLLAARPLWAFPFFYSDDGLLHLLRVFALDRDIRAGVLYPRWVSDLVFGYGYPIFNFYPPLVEFFSETVHILGLDFSAALRATFFAAILVAALGAYILGRDLFESRSSGVLTSTAFIFFPYFFTDLYTRGANGEAFAIALLPWLTWALRRIVRASDWSASILFAVFLAALILAHSLTALIAAPALLGFFLFEWLRCRENRQRALMRVTLGGILGLGLSVFYWLPFIADLSSVRMGIGVYGIQDAFQTNFLPLTRLIQPDFFYRYTNAPYPLGATALLVATVAVLVAFVARPRECGTVFYFAAVALVCALAMSEPAQIIWNALPLGTLIQFPWRVTLLLGLTVAIAVGSLPQSVSVFYRAVPRPIIVLILGLILIASSIAQLDPQPLYLENDSPTLGQLARFEAYGGFLGTTTWGEYMPVGVRAPNPLIFKPRFDTPSPAAQIELRDYSPQRRVLSVSASDAFTLTLRTLYNSAWRAQVDGNTVATFPTTNMALLSATIPAGAHQVTFELQNTFSQNLGWWIAAASLIACLIFTAINRRAPNGGWSLAALVALVVVFAIPAGVAAAARSVPLQPLQIPVSSAAQLIGVKIENANFENGAWLVTNARTSLHLTVFWHIAQPTDNHPITWRWVDASSVVRATNSSLPRHGTGVVAGWIPNEIVQDEYDLPVQSLAPGNYQLQVSWDGKQFAPVSFIVITHAAVASEPQIAQRLNARLGESIRLVGYDAPARAKAGERVSVKLFWRAEKHVNMDYTTFVQLIDAEGNAVARPRFDTVTGGGLASPFLWAPGAIVTDRVDLSLPSDFRLGSYRFIVGMYHYPEMERVNALDENGQPLDEFITLGELRVQ